VRVSEKDAAHRFHVLREEEIARPENKRIEFSILDALPVATKAPTPLLIMLGLFLRNRSCWLLEHISTFDVPTERVAKLEGHQQQPYSI